MLLEPGSVTGRMLLPDGVPARQVHLVLWAGGDGRAFNQRRRVGLSRSGAFRIQGVQAGLARLDVELDGEEEPISSLEGLYVPPGGPCADARLESLTPGAALQIVRITACDAAGEPVPAAKVRVAVNDRRWFDFGYVEDEQVLVTLRRPLTVEVSADGYRTARLSDGDGGPPRRAPHGHPRPGCASATAAPSTARTFELRVHAFGGPASALDASGEAVLAFPGPGRWRVRLQGRVPESLWRPVSTFEAVHVQDLSGEQVHVLDADPEQVAARIGVITDDELDDRTAPTGL